MERFSINLQCNVLQSGSKHNITTCLLSSAKSSPILKKIVFVSLMDRSQRESRIASASSFFNNMHGNQHRNHIESRIQSVVTTLEFFLNGAEISLNSVISANSGNLINH